MVRCSMKCVEQTSGRGAATRFGAPVCNFVGYSSGWLPSHGSACTLSMYLTRHWNACLHTIYSVRCFGIDIVIGTFQYLPIFFCVFRFSWLEGKNKRAMNEFNEMSRKGVHASCMLGAGLVVCFCEQARHFCIALTWGNKNP